MILVNWALGEFVPLKDQSRAAHHYPAFHKPNASVKYRVPTIVREGRFRVVVYGPPREHSPPHVHVEVGPDGLVVIRLGIGSSPPRVWAVYGARDQEVLAAYRLVQIHHGQLLAAWRAIHGQDIE